MILIFGITIVLYCYRNIMFPMTFPSFPTSGDIVAEIKFLLKMFPNKFRNICVVDTMFPSLSTCF